MTPHGVLPAADPAGESDPRPVVRLPKPGLPAPAIALIALVLAVALFVILDARRRHRAAIPPQAAAASTGAFTDPPPLAVPPETTPDTPLAYSLPAQMAPPSIVIRAAAPPPRMIPPPPPADPEPAQRASPDIPAVSNEPALVVDGGAQVVPATTGVAGPATAAASAEDTPVGTSLIRNHSTVVPMGTIIPAVLETPIDSTRGGMVRALVSDDARGFDGKRVLIPRGSRLIGEFASDIRLGQKRVLVTWTRLIRPDGVAMRIGSPAADALGGAGVAGQVNNFFLQRFASAVLQTALSVSGNLVARGSNGSVFVGVPDGSAASVGQNLLPTNDLKPRIRVREGAIVAIFVAHDLDFSGAPKVRKDRPS